MLNDFVCLRTQEWVVTFVLTNYLFLEFFETLLGYLLLGGSLAESLAEGALVCSCC